MVGHRYNLYPERDLPHIDTTSHLIRWNHFVQDHVLRQDFIPPTTPLFPLLSFKTFKLDTSQPITLAGVQKLLDIFVKGAQLDSNGKYKYTTHTFRRGGCQYYFIYAPLDKRYSLEQCRWWGGWREGESVSSLQFRSIFLMLILRCVTYRRILLSAIS